MHREPGNPQDGRASGTEVLETEKQLVATPVIALASTKGGVGKTTIAFSLASEFVRRLQTRIIRLRDDASRPCIMCLDADPNRTLAEAVRLSGIPELRVMETDGEGTLSGEELVRRFLEEFDAEELLDDPDTETQQREAR